MSTSTISVSFSHRRSERGASLVEYAFVVILFLALIFGVSGFGHALFVYHHLNNAAKEGTRYAAVRGYTCSNDSSCVAGNSATGITGPTTTADVQAYVQTITPASIDSTSLIITVCGVQGASACAASGPAVCTTNITDGSGNIIQAKEANYPGCTVSVQVAYAYNFIFPLIPQTTTTTAPCKVAGYCMSSNSEMIIVH
jgi:Flp pilus assembly protein TadG